MFHVGWRWVEGSLNSQAWLGGIHAPHHFAILNMLIGGTAWLFLGLVTIPPIRVRLGALPFVLVGGVCALVLGWWVYPFTAWFIGSWWVSGIWPVFPFHGAPGFGVMWVAFYPWVYLVSALLVRIALLLLSALVSSPDGYKRGTIAINWAAFGTLFRAGTKRAARAYMNDPNPTWEEVAVKVTEDFLREVGKHYWDLIVKEVEHAEREEARAEVEERLSRPHRLALALENGYKDVATLHQIILPGLVGKRVYAPLLALDPADLAALTNLGPLHPSAVGRKTALTMYNEVASGLPAVYKAPVTAVVVPRLTWTPSNRK